MEKPCTIEEFIEDRNAHGLRYDTYRAFLQRVNPERYHDERCRQSFELCERILKLKHEKHVWIDMHNYVDQDIIGVADAFGDSYKLAVLAQQIPRDVVTTVVGAKVRFMNETTKILNPTLQVIQANRFAGCSLADSIDAEALEEARETLRDRYPDLYVMAYVNTTAEVKALSDVCCTSRNAVAIAKKLPNRTLMFIPDENLGREVARQLGEAPLPYASLQTALPQKRIVDQRGDSAFFLWQGHCYVHQEINPELVHQLKAAYPDIAVLAHPECTPEVLRLIDDDKILSTEGMMLYVRKSAETRFALLTSCGLPELIRAELPLGKEILFDFGACRHCQFMARIKLEGILRVLEDEREAARNEIHLAPEVLEKARIPLERMIELSQN
ncbi:MAG: quinolinate synthase NadA [Nitrospinae bacterium]|nr:quinolinate synthase NadA [Nitrospinota bacterium]